MAWSVCLRDCLKSGDVPKPPRATNWQSAAVGRHKSAFETRAEAKAHLFTAAALAWPNFLDAITRKTKTFEEPARGYVMELWQAFLLGMMVAWPPGLIVRAILRREIKTAGARTGWG